MKAADRLSKVDPAKGAAVKKSLEEIKDLTGKARAASREAGKAMTALRQDPQNQGLKDTLRVKTVESQNARDMVKYAEKRLAKTLRG